MSPLRRPAPESVPLGLFDCDDANPAQRLDHDDLREVDRVRQDPLLMSTLPVYGNVGENANGRALRFDEVVEIIKGWLMGKRLECGG